MKIDLDLSGFVKRFAFFMIIIGAFNWGLEGVFNFGLGTGDIGIITRTVMILSGLSAVYLFVDTIRKRELHFELKKRITA